MLLVILSIPELPNLRMMALPLATKRLRGRSTENLPRGIGASGAPDRICLKGMRHVAGSVRGYSRPNS